MLDVTMVMLVIKKGVTLGDLQGFSFVFVGFSWRIGDCFCVDIFFLIGRIWLGIGGLENQSFVSFSVSLERFSFYGFAWWICCGSNVWRLFRVHKRSFFLTKCKILRKFDCFLGALCITYFQGLLVLIRFYSYAFSFCIRSAFNVGVSVGCVKKFPCDQM